MEGESGVNRSMIDELRCSGIEGDQLHDGSDVTRSIIDGVHSSDIQGDQIACESGVT